jgi:alkanesulfonate monooxygenase SsuD/methylene tetrahydromethanopterin reductase-like flavin-dependent oxidoreductase (luciferase family)
VADPWVALSAIALATETLRLGPMVTPLARRRVQKVARETVTLDHLSNGRLTVGVGLGNPADLVPFGEVVDPRERARVLDESLEQLDGFWRGNSTHPRSCARGFPSGSRRNGPIAVRSDERSDGTGCSRSIFPDPNSWPRSPRRQIRRVGAKIASIWSWK